jgi:hypothetical protein
MADNLALETGRVLRRYGDIYNVLDGSIGFRTPAYNTLINDERSVAQLKLGIAHVPYTYKGTSYDLSMVQHASGIFSEDDRLKCSSIVICAETDRANVFPIFSIVKAVSGDREIQHYKDRGIDLDAMETDDRRQFLDRIDLQPAGLRYTGFLRTDDPAQVEAALAFVRIIEKDREGYLPDRPEDVVIPDDLFLEMPYMRPVSTTQS